LIPNPFAGQFFKIVGFRQQVRGHHLKALGQAPIIAIFRQARAHAGLTPEIHSEKHGTVSLADFDSDREVAAQLKDKCQSHNG
jgi:hypothetical protein